MTGTRQRATWGAGPGDWLLAYFGFLNANKGGETLVRALKNLVAGGRPARLLMVGGQVGASDPTNFAYLEKVKGIIGELGLVERVGWTGFTDPAEVSANLCAADCAVLPYREGASLRHGSLMAALAHGLPIVTTREPVAHSDAAPGAPPGAAPIDADFPRLEDGISAMLVAPNDSTVLAAAVERVMASEASAGLACCRQPMPICRFWLGRDCPPAPCHVRAGGIDLAMLRLGAIGGILVREIGRPDDPGLTRTWCEVSRESLLLFWRYASYLAWPTAC